MLSELQRIREALERQQIYVRPPRDRYAGLKAGIYAAIGAVAFNTCDLIARAEKDESLAACLDPHRARSADSLGRILGGISRHAPIGDFHVVRISRDKGGAVWAVIKVTPGDVDALVHVTTSSTALLGDSFPAGMPSMKRATR